MQEDDIHPRPQLTRERWIDLGGTWQFAFDDTDIGYRTGWMNWPEVFDRSIQVPFPPDSRASGIGDPAPHPVVWYRQTFHVAPVDRQERLMLHFGAVDYHAHVWVNGYLVAQHEGGHTPFSADITAALRDGADEQTLVVRAADSPTDLTQPRGKQYWEARPRRIWYHRTTDIWQPVWLEPVPVIHVTEIRWTPDLDRGLLGVQVRLSGEVDRPLRLRLRLSLHDMLLADDTYLIERSELRRAVALDAVGLAMSRDRLLWSPAKPNLIDAMLTVLEVNTWSTKCAAMWACAAPASPTVVSCSMAGPTTCGWCWSKATGPSRTWRRPAA